MLPASLQINLARVLILDNALTCGLTQGYCHFYSQSFLHQSFLSLVLEYSYAGGNILGDLGLEWALESDP